MICSPQAEMQERRGNLHERIAGFNETPTPFALQSNRRALRPRYHGVEAAGCSAETGQFWKQDLFKQAL